MERERGGGAEREREGGMGQIDRNIEGEGGGRKREKGRGWGGTEREVERGEREIKRFGVSLQQPAPRSSLKREREREKRDLEK